MDLIWLCVVCPGLALWRRAVLASVVVVVGRSPLLALFTRLNLATDAFDPVGRGIVVKVLHDLVLRGTGLPHELSLPQLPPASRAATAPLTARRTCCSW